MKNIKRFINSTGERFAVLLDRNGNPLTYPNLYATINLRNRGFSVNTIVAVLEDIKLLLQLCKELDINIEKRIEMKQFLKVDEIESISNLANFKREYLLNKKIDSKFSNFSKKLKKESIRSKLIFKNNCYVSKDLVYRRLTNFSEYNDWLENYFHPSCKTKNKLFFKSRRPRIPNYVSDSYKSFNANQLSKILDVIDPKNNNKAWKNEFLSYRNELIVYLFLYFGCRKGELLNIKLLDIIEADNIKFSSSTQNKVGALYINIKRKHDDARDTRLYQPLVKTRDRSIAVNLKLREKLENYIIKYRSLVKNAELNDFLIISNQGKALSITALNKVFLKISMKTSFNVYAHAFRHTWNDKFTEKSQELISSGDTTENRVESDRSYLMGWAVGSQSARRYSKRAENERAINIGLAIQNEFKE